MKSKFVSNTIMWMAVFIFVVWLLASCNPSKKAAKEIAAQEIINTAANRKFDSGYKKGYGQGQKDWALSHPQKEVVKYKPGKPFYDSAAFERDIETAKAQFEKDNDSGDSCWNVANDAFKSGVIEGKNVAKFYYETHPRIDTVETENTSKIELANQEIADLKEKLAAANATIQSKEQSFKEQLTQQKTSTKSWQRYSILTWIGIAASIILLAFRFKKRGA